MHVAVIGAPAGLTAAHRPVSAGHGVTVLEAEDVPGGRTRTVHFGDGHRSDICAGWLASFYTATLRLFGELGGRRGLRPMQLRGGGDLLLDGEFHPTPNSISRLFTTALLGPVDTVRIFAWMALFVVLCGDWRVQSRVEGAVRSGITAAGWLDAADSA